MLTFVQDRIVASTVGLFSHGPRPLERTLDHPGDPGLLGPESVSWRVIGDASAFVAGIRALVVQTAHPEVVAGVEDHSRYRSDPLGRLSRTSRFVTETTYGAMPEVDAAVAAVRRAHRPVQGRSERDRPYRASAPELAAWVHNVLTDSFLVSYQQYGPERLSAADADRFVAEQARVGSLLGASPLPDNAGDLHNWIVQHPALDSSAALRASIAFLRSPPLPLVVRPAYRLLHDAALATVPARIADIVDAHPTVGATTRGAASVRFLRWALGSSPSWHLALVRVGADVPARTFRQPLPDGVEIGVPA